MPKNKSKRTAFIFEESKASAVYFWFDNNEDGLQLSRQWITKGIVKNKFAPMIRRDTEDLGAHALRATYQNYLFYEKNFDMTLSSLYYLYHSLFSR